MWVSSAEFAAKFEIEYEALKKSCVRASKIGKKFCKFKCNLLFFSYFNGIGRGGKVLKIWDTPFKSEGEAECFLAEYAKEMAENGGVENGGQRTENGTQNADNGTQRVDTSALPQYDNVNALSQRNNNGKSHDLTHPQTAGATQWGFLPHNEGANPTKKATNAKAQNIAIEKMSIVKEWERAKTKMNAKDFIALTNAKGDYSINISENKLYAWQKAFKAGGFDALVDSRGGSKASSIESLGLSQIVTKLIMASRGRVNISSMHRLLHAHLAMSGLCDMKAFLGKESEYVSYGVLERFVKNYLKANPLQKIIIQKGEDGVVSVNLIAQKERVWIKSGAFGIRLKDLALCEVNPLIANMNAKQKDFVAKAKAHLSKGRANKTQLLLACGFEKDDKFARGVLEDFEGIFWVVKTGGYKNKALEYELLKGAC